MKLAKLRVLWIGLACVAICAGQASPPPATDQALRERIGKFYQAHVDGKYRQAEQYIAEENRDDFYTQAKTKYLSFTESKVDYSDDFTKAVVHTPTEMMWRVAQLGEMKLKKIVESNWKMVDGQWYWYQPAGVGMLVPFGPDGKPVAMKPGPPSDTPSGQSVGDRVKNFDRGALNKVEINKNILWLNKNGKSSDTVSLTNGLSGVVVMQVDCNDLPGLEVKVTPSSKQLKPGETGTVQFSYTAPAKVGAEPAVRARILIQPTQQNFPVVVNFKDNAVAPPAARK